MRASSTRSYAQCTTTKSSIRYAFHCSTFVEPNPAKNIWSVFVLYWLEMPKRQVCGVFSQIAHVFFTGCDLLTRGPRESQQLAAEIIFRPPCHEWLKVKACLHCPPWCTCTTRTNPVLLVKRVKLAKLHPRRFIVVFFSGRSIRKTPMEVIVRSPFMV